MTIAPLEHPEVAAGIALLEAWVESQRSYRGVPGLSMGIVYDQALVWARGFGQSDQAHGTLATPDTRYRIASISKLFTSTAIMQLRDQGLLRLDDPIVAHLPWFRMGSRYQDAPAITIQHLLTHTSGLPREAAGSYWNDGLFPSSVQLRDALPSQEQVFAPETQWKYSNLALTLAGEIVAAVAGQPFTTYMQAYLLDPLGMTSTSVAPGPAPDALLAVGYGRRMPDGQRDVRPFNDLNGLTPAGNMSSTVTDLARFASLQFRDGPAGGAQVLKGSTLREMHRVHWLNPDWQSGWGIGFVVRRRGQSTLVEHGGSLPGYRTQLSIIPADKIAVIVLTNADDGDPLSYVEQALTLVAPALARAMAPAPAPQAADPAWQRYVGSYRSPWGDTAVLVLNGRLALATPTDLDPRATLLYLLPEGPHSFRIAGDNGYSALGELAVFELDDAGRVARLKVGAVDTYPLH